MAQQQERPQPVVMTGKAVSQGQFSYAGTLFHWTMIVCTCGIWYPIYASAKRKRRTVTRYTR